MPEETTPTPAPPNEDNVEELSTREIEIRKKEKESATRLKGTEFTVTINIPPQDGASFSNWQTIFSHAVAQSNKQIGEKVDEYLK